MKNLLSKWLYSLIKPYIDEVVDEIYSETKRELYEISALQKRDIRQYVFEKATSIHGFLNAETLFEKDGIYFKHGSPDKPIKIKLLDGKKTFYNQDEIVKLIETFESYLTQYQK